MRLRSFIALAIPIGMAVASPDTAEAGTGLVTESVANYSACGDSTGVPNANTDANGFMNNLAGHSGFTRSFQLQDSLVYDSDFYDPEVTLSTGDHDTSYADATGNAITYYAGHGLGSSAPIVACNHDADCASVPSGFNGPGKCETYPRSNYENNSNGASPGICRWWYWDSFITCSPEDSHGGYVSYAQPRASGGGIAWGESANSGPWGGAGTNGGINALFASSSDAVGGGFWNQALEGVFAGIHMVGMTMPISGDTTVVADRGGTFSNFGAVNPNGSVGLAWTDNTMSTLSSSDGGSCGGISGAGGKGFNGCGCNVVLGVDSSATWAAWHATQEDWYDVQNDQYDVPAAGGYTLAHYSCNYAVNNYSFDN